MYKARAFLRVALTYDDVYVAWRPLLFTRLLGVLLLVFVFCYVHKRRGGQQHNRTCHIVIFESFCVLCMLLIGFADGFCWFGRVDAIIPSNLELHYSKYYCATAVDCRLFRI